MPGCHLQRRPDGHVSGGWLYWRLFLTIRAVQAGIHVALANKETLVMAGELVMRPDQPTWGRIIPVDSEHNAIFQALHGHQRTALRRILLTASVVHFGSGRAKQCTMSASARRCNIRIGKWGGKLPLIQRR